MPAGGLWPGKHTRRLVFNTVLYLVITKNIITGVHLHSFKVSKRRLHSESVSTWNESLIAEGISQCHLKSELLSDLCVHLQILLTLIILPSFYKVINWAPRIIQDNLRILKSELNHIWKAFCHLR